MDYNKQEKMTKSWKDRATGGIVALLLAIIPVLVAFRVSTKYDEKQSVIQKIQELDKTKLSIPEFKDISINQTIKCAMK